MLIYYYMSLENSHCGEIKLLHQLEAEYRRTLADNFDYTFMDMGNALSLNFDLFISRSRTTHEKYI